MERQGRMPLGNVRVVCREFAGRGEGKGCKGHIKNKQKVVVFHFERGKDERRSGKLIGISGKRRQTKTGVNDEAGRKGE